ncbi:hypothetical protein [Burkholderia reimsis]|uniref:hypothetical protein n=1 Tax=Burkholderia reimsis TaxID=2234132 RepID=UPI001058B027|nr:hypothetical protein [Burkholderia reimsis]
MELGSTILTPVDDTTPVTLQYKFYWVHERLWDQSWIEKYQLATPGLAREIQSRKGASGQYTCEDFALEILIEFASRNKLPLKIKTESRTFKNVEEVFDVDGANPPTPAGFALDVAFRAGAPDVVANSQPVSLSDLKPGDMFAEFNRGHIQVVTSVSPNRIEIMQGNFPGPLTVVRKQHSWTDFGFLFRDKSTDARESPNYLGVPVQNAVYEFRNGSWFYQRMYGDDRRWDPKPWGDQSIHIRWNFLEFNRL